MRQLLLILCYFSGGVLAGGAYSAFITLIRLIPRLMQLTETYSYERLYESVFITSTIVFSLTHFLDYSINIGRLGIIIVGLLMGIYLGMFTSALAETLNVIPIISKKFKIKKQLTAVIIAMAIGKVCGSLYFFIFSGG